MAASSGLYAIGFARHAAERTAATLHCRLGRGITSLQAIACTAPLLGMLGTVVPMIHSFRAAALPGFGNCCCAGGVAEIYSVFAVSLPVTIFAMAGWQCLRRQVEAFDLEMRIATLDLLNDLSNSIKLRAQ
jgi:biopolymer transport protein ExbB